MTFLVQRTTRDFFEVEADNPRDAIEAVKKNTPATARKGTTFYGARALDGGASQRDAATTPQPWPVALLPLKLLAKEGDRGAGDIIARTIGPIGGDAFKKWYRTLFGKACGCGNRQAALNARWPL